MLDFDPRLLERIYHAFRLQYYIARMTCIMNIMKLMFIHNHKFKNTGCNQDRLSFYLVRFYPQNRPTRVLI